MKNSIRNIVTTGMVAVPSGIVTADDMARADETALNVNRQNPVICRTRLYFKLATGESIQDPKGMQSSRLLSIWQLTEIDEEALNALIKKDIHELG